MTDQQLKLIAAKADADRQLALVRDSLSYAVGQARGLLAAHDETETWALLGQDIARQLSCETKHQQFAAEMLALAAIELARAK